jgi:hypothetical protein
LKLFSSDDVKQALVLANGIMPAERLSLVIIKKVSLLIIDYAKIGDLSTTLSMDDIFRRLASPTNIAFGRSSPSFKNVT